MFGCGNLYIVSIPNSNDDWYDLEVTDCDSNDYSLWYSAFLVSEIWSWWSCERNLAMASEVPVVWLIMYILSAMVADVA